MSLQQALNNFADFDTIEAPISTMKRVIHDPNDGRPKAEAPIAPPAPAPAVAPAPPAPIVEEAPHMLMECRNRKNEENATLVVSLYQTSESWKAHPTWAWLDRIEFDYVANRKHMLVEIYCGGRKRLHQRESGHPCSRTLDESITQWVDRTIGSGQVKGVSIVFPADLFSKEQVVTLHSSCLKPRYNEASSAELVRMFTASGPSPAPIAPPLGRPKPAAPIAPPAPAPTIAEAVQPVEPETVAEHTVQPIAIDRLSYNLSGAHLKTLWLQSFGTNAPRLSIADLNLLFVAKLKQQQQQD
jgi:hypothetical protein